MCERGPELLIFQGELVDDADQCRDVGAQAGEFGVLAGIGLVQRGDGGAQADLVAGGGTAFAARS
ncbi:hypothetical protein [Saccharothrix saharensis]|uniref:hypothetical protein n=1 Tax=Saccharothrix saharensis TaxID=571190 RepID=UPI0014781B93|nr:hypothetical protein [Saccharothrix saharensis]